MYSKVKTATVADQIAKTKIRQNNGGVKHAWVIIPPAEFIWSKFLRSWFSQCLVDLSSLRHALKVSSLSWSGRHWQSASQALKVLKNDEITIKSF